MFSDPVQLNQSLKEILAHCKEGARIVSSLNFAPTDFTITARNLNDIATILTVSFSLLTAIYCAVLISSSELRPYPIERIPFSHNLGAQDHVPWPGRVLDVTAF